MYKAVEVAKMFAARHIKTGDTCIDATCGNGGDTLFLSRAVGASGKILAFDIQEHVLAETKNALNAGREIHNIQFIGKSHIYMDEYVTKESVSCIMFNLGWLPGGDHALRTEASATIEALEKALNLIAPGGIISVCLYCGKEMGYEEKKAVLAFSESISKSYDVIYIDYPNKHDPPTNLFIIKKRLS